MPDWLGQGDEDLSEVEFRPGESALAAPELEKLAEALMLRPELVVEVPGVLDTEADTHALRKHRITEEIERRLDEDGDSEAILRERQRRIMEALAEERLETELSALQAEYTSPQNPEEPEGGPIFDDLAYVAVIESLLVENEMVGEEDLQLLANDRAAAIRAALLLNSEVDETRIVIIENETGELNATGWIPLELSLNAN